MMQPFGAEVQESGVFMPPTRSALTPLLDMNSVEVGRTKPCGRLPVSVAKVAARGPLALRV